MVGSGSFRRRSRRQLDAVADGASDGSPLGDFVSEMRSLGDGEGVVPGRALTEFVSAPSREHDTVVAALATESKARNPMIAHLSALAATTVGKVVLTGGVAAAAVGGAVVVNEIQEPPGVEVVASGESSDSTTSTTSTSVPESTSTSTTAPESSTSTSTSSSSSTTTVPGSGAVVDTEPITVDAEGAGTVTYQVRDGQLVLLDATPAAGWTLYDETRPAEIDLSFRAVVGSERVDVEIEIDDGQPRVRIERNTDDEESDGEDYDSDYDDDDSEEVDSDYDDDSDYDSDDDYGSDEDGDDDEDESDDDGSDDDEADDSDDESGED